MFEVCEYTPSISASLGFEDWKTDFIEVNSFDIGKVEKMFKENG